MGLKRRCKILACEAIGACGIAEALSDHAICEAVFIA